MCHLYSWLLFMALLQCCIAYDVVVFSTLTLKKMTVKEVAAASPKLLAVAVKDFTLPKFNTYAQAYSAHTSHDDTPIAFLTKIFTNMKALPMAEPLKVPQNDNDAVKYMAVESLENLKKSLTDDKELKDYQTVIISSSDAFENELIRHKRVSSDVNFDDEPPVTGENSGAAIEGTNRQQLLAAGDQSAQMPVILPRMNSTNMSCLLYMEAFDIIILSQGSTHYLTVGSDNRNKYDYLPLSDYYICNVTNGRGVASFTISVTTGEEIAERSGEKGFSLSSGANIKFKLDFIGAQKNGYWYLNETSLLEQISINYGGKNVIIVPKSSATNTVSIGSVPGVDFACFQTEPALFKTNDATFTHIGIALRNFEVSLGVTGGKFGYYTTDCIGTFTAGTWMGIVIALVLVTILMFGYLMVQSIQTMDRFDDPKQKQIVINFKE